MIASKQSPGDRGFLMTKVDAEIVRTARMFNALQMYLTLNFWGPQTRLHMDVVSMDLKQYLSKTIAFGEEFGSCVENSTRLKTFTAANRAIQNNAFFEILEYFLSNVMLPHIQKYENCLEHFEKSFYTNTRAVAPSITQLVNMTFKPLLGYMRKLGEDFDYYFKTMEDEKIRMDPWIQKDEQLWHERKKFLIFLKSLYDFRNEELNTNYSTWMRARKYHPHVVPCDPWDHTFDSFHRIYNEVTSKLLRFGEEHDKLSGKEKKKDDVLKCKKALDMLVALKTRGFKLTQ